MHVYIAGGHGQVALRLARLLSKDGHQVTGLVRNPDHEADLTAAGASTVVCDLEDTSVEQVANHLREGGADAAVFAAGAGPGSGAPRKLTVDRDAAVLLADAAEQAGVNHVIQVSAMGAGAEPPSGADEVFAAYLDAKGEAEDDLRSRSMDWTILRPGRLTDDAGTGQVHLAPPPVTLGDITRDDTAAVLAELLTTGRGTRLTLGLVAGETPVADAVGALN